MRQPRLRVAYGSVPKESGTFTFFRNHRPCLAELGVDVTCVSIGRAQAALWNPDFADSHCVQLAPETDALKSQAQQFVRWCSEQAIDIVMPVNSPGMISALPHLPSTVAVVGRCANAFHEGYSLATAWRERISRIVALAPRLRDDLIQDYGVPADQLTLIPNGVDLARFFARQHPNTAASLRLGFVGRLEHRQKGVLYLPEILNRLRAHQVPFVMQIAGTGRDEAGLRRAVETHQLTDRVSFAGSLNHAEIPEFLSEVDILLFPSQFEGCPNTLLEAMAAGCVPVGWKLPGITDFLVRDGMNGDLVPVGDVSQFAQRIESLHQHRSRLFQRSLAARESCLKLHSLARCAQQYASLFRQVASQPTEHPVLPWRDFSVPDCLRSRYPWLPAPLRRQMKTWLGHLQLG